jgi:hypothetical protein
MSIVSGCAGLVALCVLGCACTRVQIYEGISCGAAGASTESAGAVAIEPRDAGIASAGALAIERSDASTVIAPIPQRTLECEQLGPFDAVPLTAEDVACTKNEDCVRGEASCCPTCNPENIIAIHVDAEDFASCCPLRGCPKACAPYESQRYARCIAGRCGIVDLSGSAGRAQ